MRFKPLILLFFAHAASVADASGRNWRIAVQSLQCQGNGLLVMGARVHHRGPDGAVEAPTSRSSMRRATLIVRSEMKPGGGVEPPGKPVTSASCTRFPVHSASGALELEFGDIRAFTVSRDACSASQAGAGEGCARRRRPLPQKQCSCIPRTLSVLGWAQPHG